MKLKTFARPLLAVVALWLGVTGAARAQEGKGRSETVDLKLLRVIEAQDGPYRQRTFLVEWNGKQVVADDPVRRGSYSADKPLAVRVYKAPYPKGAKPHGLMRFSVAMGKQVAAPTSELETKADSLPPQREMLKVTQAFVLEEDGHRHRAYLVARKGGEAFVTDILSGTNFSAGDTIPVLVMRHAHPDPAVKEGILGLSTSETRVGIAEREQRR